MAATIFRAIFTQLDYDRNGVITFDDLARTLPAQVHPDDVLACFGAQHTDHITYDEFCNQLRRIQEASSGNTSAKGSPLRVRLVTLSPASASSRITQSFDAESNSGTLVTMSPDFVSPDASPNARRRLTFAHFSDESTVTSISRDPTPWTGTLHSDDAAAQERAAGMHTKIQLLKYDKAALQSRCRQLMALGRQMEYDLSATRSRAVDLESKLTLSKRSVSALRAANADLQSQIQYMRLKLRQQMVKDSENVAPKQRNGTRTARKMSLFALPKRFKSHYDAWKHSLRRNKKVSTSQICKTGQQQALKPKQKSNIAHISTTHQDEYGAAQPTHAQGLDRRKFERQFKLLQAQMTRRQLTRLRSVTKSRRRWMARALRLAAVAENHRSQIREIESLLKGKAEFLSRWATAPNLEAELGESDTESHAADTQGNGSELQQSDRPRGHLGTLIHLLVANTFEESLDEDAFVDNSSQGTSGALNGEPQPSAVDRAQRNEALRHAIG